jgi:hypothetical protein
VKLQAIPFDFVLEELESKNPIVGLMFGCYSIYVDGKIVLILRDRPSSPEDNGVWIATTVQHHESLLKDLPTMRSIGVLGAGITGWQVIPTESDYFERDALKACQMVILDDVRIGKIPKPKRGSGLNKRSKGSHPRASKKSEKTKVKIKPC